MSADPPGQAAGGHREDAGEGGQQGEVHQQPAGASDPGLPQRPGQAQRGEGLSSLIFITTRLRSLIHVSPALLTLQAKERYQQASGGVTERTRVLAEVSERTTINYLYT